MATRDAPDFLLSSTMRLVAAHPRAPTIVRRAAGDHPLDQFEGKMTLNTFARLHNSLLPTEPTAVFPTARIIAGRKHRWNTVPQAVADAVAENAVSAHLASTNEDKSLALDQITAGTLILSARNETILTETRAIASMLSRQIDRRIGHALDDLRDLPGHIIAAASPAQFTTNGREAEILKRHAGSAHHIERLAAPGLLARRLAREMASFDGRAAPYDRDSTVRVSITDEVIIPRDADLSLRTRAARSYYRQRFMGSLDVSRSAARTMDDFELGIVTGRVSDPINDLLEKRRKRMDRALDSGTYEDFKRAHDRLKVHEADSKRIGAMLTDIVRMVQRIRLYDDSSGVRWHIMRHGVVGEVGRRCIALTSSDLREVMTLSDEATGVVLAIATELGASHANRVATAILRMWDGIAEASADEANMCAVIQRAVDGASKASSVSAIPNDKKCTFEQQELNTIVADYGALATRWLPVIMSATNSTGLADFSSIRAMRSMPFFRFSIPAIMTKHRELYNSYVAPSPVAMSRLEMAAKMTLAMMHRRKHGRWPRSLYQMWVRNKSNAAVRGDAGGRMIVDDFADWVPDGDGVWDWDCARVRDKTNIIPDISAWSTVANWKSIPLTSRREILYYNNKRWVDDAKAYHSKLLNKESLSAPTVLTAKGEPKEFARVITMESCQKRRFNSLINNNLAPLVTTWPGNLMGVSASQKARNYEQIGRDFSQASIKGQTPYHVITDFKSFGHHVNHETNTVLMTLLGQYFRMPELSRFPRALFEETFFCMYNGYHMSFENKTGTDGQGMRNMLWEWLLISMPYAILSDLSTLIPGVVAGQPLKITLYMDDHHFHVVMRGHAGSLAAHVENHRKIHSGLAEAFRPYGLVLVASKGITSTVGFVLLGDTHDKGGLVRVAGKGAGGALRNPRSRAPSFADEISSATSAASAMVNSGCRPIDAFVFMAGCMPYIIGRYMSAVTPLGKKAIALKLLAPRALGGLNIPVVQHLCSGLAPGKEDDGLWICYYHARYLTSYAREAAAILAQIPPTTVKPNIRGRMKVCKRTNIYSSHLMKEIEAKISLSGGATLKQMRAHMYMCLAKVRSATRQLPFTVASAIAQAHPFQMYEADTNALLESASAAALVTPAATRRSRAINRARARRWLQETQEARGFFDMSDHNWASFVETAIIDPTGSTGPPVMPSKCSFMRVETPEDEEYYTITARDMVHYHHGRYLTYGAAAPPYHDLGGLWHTRDRSAMALSCDVATAEATSAVGTNNLIRRLMRSAWGGVDLMYLGKSGRGTVPFRDIPAMAFVPPANLSGLSRFAASGS
jgi:hypothetical protein